MSKAGTFSVTILDKEYQVACPPEQQAELLLSARHLDEQMRAIRSTGKVIGLERIAVMAALNISHELLQMRSGVGVGAAEERGGEAADESGPASAASSAQPAELSAAEARSVAGLNAKLDEALHQLRQLEIG
ncbi:MAG: cell division protein ZapA [Pseudomonadota bacterium]